jgi:hypothetical protein
VSSNYSTNLIANPNPLSKVEEAHRNIVPSLRNCFYLWKPIHKLRYGTKKANTKFKRSKAGALIEAYRLVRYRGSHSFSTIGLQMTIGSQLYSPAALYSTWILLVIIYVRGWIKLRDIVRLQVSGELKNLLLTSPGFVLSTFQLVA